MANNYPNSHLALDQARKTLSDTRYSLVSASSKTTVQRPSSAFSAGIVSLYSALITDFWALEILNWFLAAIAFAAICLTLGLHQERPVPQWPSNITLNSLLSLLSLLGQWGLTGLAAKLIGQFKWLFFVRKDRPLKHFDTFDEASRGPWGSFLLLIKGWPTDLVSLAALVVLGTQAFQPFVQQAVTYPLRPDPAGNATMDRTTTFSAVDGLGTNFTKTYLINQMKAGVFNGLYNPNATLSDVPASCKSGNCTLPVHYSLAICASTVDVTPLLQKICLPSSQTQCNYTLPSPNDSLAGPNDVMGLLTTSYPSPSSVAFANSSPIIDFYTFLISNKTSQPLLLESALHLCVQRYNTTVTDGKTLTQQVGSSFADLSHVNPYNVSVPNEPGTDYVMGGYSFSSMTDFLASVFRGRYTIQNDIPTYGSDAIEVLVDALLVPPYDLAAMQIVLAGVATGMTNALRSNPWSSPVTGTSYTIRPYVSVRWAWLTLPALLVLVSLVVLLSTITQTRRRKVKVWKNSAVATLRGLGGDLHAELGGLERTSAMEEALEGRKVRLVRSEGDEGGEGWRLVRGVR